MTGKVALKVKIFELVFFLTSTNSSKVSPLLVTIINDADKIVLVYNSSMSLHAVLII